MDDCNLAISNIDLYNSCDDKTLKTKYLQTAVNYLRSCLEYRPGNHLLRRQTQLCEQELYEMIDDTPSTTITSKIETIIAPHLF